jgi:putative transposase
MIEVCDSFGVTLVEFNGEHDHVHLLVHYPPKVALSTLVNSLKGVSARMLRKEFPAHIRRHLWGGHFWSSSYFAASCGGAPLSIIKEFLKSVLGWTSIALRHPEQADRWTWTLLAAYTQILLARHLAQDQRYPWERCHHRRLSPGRVCRDFPRLLIALGAPATPPKPSKAGPGRPKGRTSTPAPRHPALKKAS